MLPLPQKIFSKYRIMQNRSEPCICDKYPCQSGTDRQKGEVFAYICDVELSLAAKFFTIFSYIIA